MTLSKKIFYSFAVVYFLSLGSLFAYWHLDKKVDKLQMKDDVSLSTEDEVLVPSIREREEIASLNNKGQYEEAQEEIKKTIGNSDSPEYKLMLANSYLNEGSARGTEFESSKKAQEILFELEKKYKSVYLYDLIAYSYEIVDEYEMAIKYYDLSLEIDPRSVNSLFGKGHTYWLFGDNEIARDFYYMAQDAITEETDDSVKIKVFAGIGVLENDFNESELYFLDALAISESKSFIAEMYYNLVTLSLVKKDNKKAIEYAEKSLEADPSSELAHLAYVISVMNDKEMFEKNIDNVKEHLIKSVFLAQKKAEPQYWVGKFNFSLGDYDEAINSYEVALSLLDGDNSINSKRRNFLRSDINFDLALTYFLKDDLSPAKDHIKLAFQYNPIKTMYVLGQDEKFNDLLKMLTENN